VKNRKDDIWVNEKLYKRKKKVGGFHRVINGKGGGWKNIFEQHLKGTRYLKCCHTNGRRWGTTSGGKSIKVRCLEFPLG